MAKFYHPCQESVYYTWLEKNEPRNPGAQYIFRLALIIRLLLDELGGGCDSVGFYGQ